MTQKDKDLLLKDLSSRLPYNPMVVYKGETYSVLGITHERLVLCKPFMSHILDEFPLVKEVNPYLFPMSSMTEEQKTELNDTLIQLELKALNDEIEHHKVAEFEIDFYNKNMFDYRGLIEKGLANDATGLNIY